ncbi:hypothetical protein DEO72_LG4g628 [Vigna unguiculata]|uniref:Uncharacterized protein n=1 Tax=Vigna unguiculata TaxID=3917 RepID=A0A4D6LLL9_VIGUN|nr:hypothetical protein DEO72_LG4g628 [Vigna unguiculata]
MSQDYQTRQPTTKEGNLFGPIRTGHNQHTHIGNTRQPVLNSRVPRVHPPSRAQLEGCHSELNSRNVRLTTAKSPSRGHVPPGAKRLRISISLATARRSSAYRQADVIQETTDFVAIAWRDTPFRPAPPIPEAHFYLAIAWRVQSHRQAPHQ